MGSSESEEPSSRKRARNSTGPSEPGVGGKKQRGRPKVDTQDETAADRRRTQIRLAQRAYRQRKETTITSLQNQVEQLQSVIDNMNNSFLRFNDQAMASDIFALRPHLASGLKETTETFVNLARTAKTVGSEDEREDGHDDPDPAPAPAHAPALSASLDRQGTPDIISRNVYEEVTRPAQNVVDAASDQAQNAPPPTHVGWGYFKLSDESRAPHYGQTANFYSGFGLPNVSTSTVLASAEATVTESHQLRSCQPATVASFPFRSTNELGAEDTALSMPSSSGGRDPYASQYETATSNTLTTDIHGRTTRPPSQYMTRMPSPMHTTIQVPFSYSFQETSFGRRLQRSCLERVFHLISASNLRPGAFQRVFRLCRHYSSRDELHSQFKTLLKQSVIEPLDFVKSPFQHLGGAGTHYPPRDAQGNLIPWKGDWSVQRIGPWPTVVQLENTRAGLTPDITWTAELEEDLRSYDGEWFDSQDVQGYLEELGVYIDPQASFAEVTVRSLDALAQGPLFEQKVHPDSEMAVLDEPLDQFAPNHLFQPSYASPQQRRQAAASPVIAGASVPGSSSVPGSDSRSGSGSGSGPDTTAPRSASMAPSTPSSHHPPNPNSPGVPPHAPNQQMLADFPLGFPGACADVPIVDPMAYDEWDRCYDLDFAWMGPPQASWLAPPPPVGDLGVAGPELVAERRRQRTVTIDVQRLINGLIKRSVCIGRGPGFRREDVNYALRAAVIEAF